MRSVRWWSPKLSYTIYCTKVLIYTRNKGLVCNNKGKHSLYVTDFQKYSSILHKTLIKSTWTQTKISFQALLNQKLDSPASVDLRKHCAGRWVFLSKCRMHRVQSLHCLQSLSACTCTHLWSVTVCSYEDLTHDLTSAYRGLGEDTGDYLINGRASQNKPAQLLVCTGPWRSSYDLVSAAGV